MRTRGAGESALLLLDVVDLLVAQQIEYAVVGAMAASVHGVVRASLDADVVVSIGVHGVGMLRHGMQSGGLRTEVRQGDPDDPVRGLIVVEDAFGNRVDVLLGLRGLEPQAFSRLIGVPFQGVTLKRRSMGARQPRRSRGY